MILFRVRPNLRIKNCQNAYRCCSALAGPSQPQPVEDVSAQTVHLQGWVKAVRSMKNHVFINIDNGKSPNHMQVVLPKQLETQDLTFGSSVKVKGKLVHDARGNVEVHAENIELVGGCTVTDNYPFLPRRTYHEEYARQFLHMRTRTDSFAAVLRIRNAACQAVHNFFHNNEFFLVNTPILTSSDCEGAGEVFTVKPNCGRLIQKMATEGVPQDDSFFNKKVFLSVSGQLQLEAAVRNIGKVYTFGPVFRAENSKSRFHLSEFYMVEAEMGFTENLDDVKDLVERLVRSTAQDILDHCAADVDCISKYQTRVITEYPEKRQLPPVTPKDIANCFLPASPYVTMSYDEAISVLESANQKWSKRPKRGEGLTKEHELFLVKHSGSRPIFIVDWPAELKAFYMKGSPPYCSKVFAFDLLAPIVGEICGGSLREDNYDILKRKLADHSLEEELAWYLELRKFGNVPCGGFGLGFERLLQSILLISNIKDTIPFPRFPHNCQM